MNIKTIANTFSLPEIGLGTWKIGGEREADTSRDTEWVDAIKTAIDIGYTHIDTAAMYGVGHCEELVAKAITGVNREELQIATKVFATELGYEDFIASSKASMDRLGVDYLDLHYIHGPNPDIPLVETMRALDDLVAEGLVKNIGVSNFTVELLEEAQSLTKNKIVVNQVEYNLVTREQSKYGGCTKMESEILPYCQANDMLLVAYKPIDRGSILKPHDLLDELCKKYNKTRAQIAMNWLVSQPNVVTIVKSEDPDRLQENLGASDWYMDSEDVEKLRNGFV